SRNFFLVLPKWSTSGLPQFSRSIPSAASRSFIACSLLERKSAETQEAANQDRQHRNDNVEASEALHPGRVQHRILPGGLHLLPARIVSQFHQNARPQVESEDSGAHHQREPDYDHAQQRDSVTAAVKRPGNELANRRKAPQQ